MKRITRRTTRQWESQALPSQDAARYQPELLQSTDGTHQRPDRLRSFVQITTQFTIIRDLGKTKVLRPSFNEQLTIIRHYNALVISTDSLSFFTTIITLTLINLSLKDSGNYQAGAVASKRTRGHVHYSR